MKLYRWLCHKLAFTQAEMFVLLTCSILFWGLILMVATK